jgi:hypothetical protein
MDATTPTKITVPAPAQASASQAPLSPKEAELEKLKELVHRTQDLINTGGPIGEFLASITKKMK